MANTVENDLKAGILDLAFADDDVMDLTSGNIFPTSLAEFGVDNDVSGLSFPRIHFKLIGGPSRLWVDQYFETNILIQSWSKNDYDEAWDVATAFRKAVTKKLTSKRDANFTIEVLNPGQELFDHEESLYYVSSQFRALMAEVRV